VLTLLWHDRSHAPERLWGDFYVRLIQGLRSLDGWFGTAGQVVGWFRKRREVRFELVETPGNARTRLRYQGDEIQPPLTVRIYAPASQRNDGESARKTNTTFTDIPWNGKPVDALELQIGSHSSANPTDPALCALP
jgi:hypothetical protein